jgi:hypothetical protein
MRTLRGLPAYSLWRRYREHSQTQQFGSLLSQVDASTPVYSEESLQEALRARASQRRRPENGQPLRVASYGFSDWEDCGLWQSVQRLGEGFHFDLRRDPALQWEAQRQAWSVEFLTQLDAREASGQPIHWVFFYAGGADVDLGLLATLRERGIWTVLMGLDDKQQLPEVREGEAAGRQSEVARAVDVYWTTWRTGADLLLGLGATPWYAPPGADPAFFHPVSTARDIEVLWTGRLYGPRGELVRFLESNGVALSVYGPGSAAGKVSFEEMIRLFSRAQIVLGMGGIGQTDRFKHLKGRDFEVPMCGALYLTSFNPELTDAYDIGREVLCYSSPVECLDVIRWILRRPKQAQQIRDAALRRTVAAHTWDARLARLRTLLGLDT